MKREFYKAFEERYRGSRESIALRLRVYLPFVELLSKIDKDGKIIDLGCGRGEWIELLNENGFTAHGVDLDEGMLSDCLKRGLSVEQGDAVSYLSALPNDSHVVVSAFHLVEHISLDQLHELVSEAIRVLKPGGLLIMETPNPENIIVATRDFYLDPTHQRPIPPQLLSFLTEFHGFARTKIMRLQETKVLDENASVTLYDVLNGASPDYAVIGQKSAPAEILSIFDRLFDREYGLMMDSLAEKYDAAITAKIQQAEAKVQEENARTQKAEEKAREYQNKAKNAEEIAQKAEEKAHQAEIMAKEAYAKAQQAETKAGENLIRAEQAQNTIAAIYGSRLWRITAPWRWSGDFVRWLMQGSIAWLTLAPGSRPRRVLRRKLISIKTGISKRPFLKTIAGKLLSPFPKLEMRLRLMGSAYSTDQTTIQNRTRDHLEGTDNLPTRVREIYYSLKTAFEKRNKE